ncbi:MAG: DUF934 domain-containing protein [Pseudomonadota bacterium]
MPLIKQGAEAENPWVFSEDGSGLDTAGPVSVPLAVLQAETDRLLQRNAPVGVRLIPDDDPAALADHLSALSLVEVSFPKYTDGRGYSQAQLLRRRYGYAGELRAVGHVLRDQILYMHRSGFDAFETERADLPNVLNALAEFSAFYQRAADGAQPVFAARRATGA